MTLNRREMLMATLLAPSFMPILLGAAPAARAQTPSVGTLRIAVGNDLPSSLDPARSGGLTLLGMAETLMRLTPSMRLEPWLAQQVEQVSPTQWRVTLRRGSTFWDGSPVTPEIVETSFRRSWEQTPGNKLLLPDTTVFEKIDDQTLLVRLREPQSDFLHVLAASTFVIHRMTGENTSVMTGPYKPVNFRKGETVALEAFENHWGGLPPIARIEVRWVVDANARMLALQAGDIDLVYGAPPALMAALPDTFGKLIEPTTRVHFLNLNHRCPIFSDKVVRLATSRAIDRQAIIDTVLNGAGAPLNGLLPKTTGLDVVERQATDVARARQLLDEAGWVPGADGIRAKAGQRLSFTIHTWPNRAELTPIGIAVSGQLAALGYETKIQELRDIRGQMRGADWDMATFSNNTMSAGPQRVFLNTLFEGATDNYGGYVNKDLEATVRRLRGESDAALASSLLRQAQDMVLDDAVNIYLLAAPFGVAYRKDKVARYVFHPSDVFFIASDTLAAKA